MRRVALTAVLALAGVLAGTPTAAEAQAAGTGRLGFLSGNPPSDTQEALVTFRAKLRELGHAEGKNLTIEYRYADGKYDRLPELAADLIQRKVDVIVTFSTPGARAAKKATATIPIVFGVVSDPIAAGLVTSLVRPGGNATGVTPNNPELSAKRVGLLKEALPTATRVGVLANPGFSATPEMVAETKRGAQALGIELQVLEARQPADLATAFQAMGRAKVRAAIVLADPMFIAQRKAIADLAASHRLPAMFHSRQFVDAGGLISYGAEYPEMFQQTAVLVDKILKGAKPADLPVEQPWRYTLVVNLKTAKALGLTIPEGIRLRADKLIE